MIAFLKLYIVKSKGRMVIFKIRQRAFYKYYILFKTREITVNKISLKLFLILKILTYFIIHHK